MKRNAYRLGECDGELSPVAFGKEDFMIQIRLAVESDFQRIYELNRDSLGYEYPIEKTRERLKYILTRNTDRIWVACVDDLVVGYIHGADYECTYSDTLKNIMAIAVDERYRRNGIGRRLLENLEDWAMESGCIGVRLVSGYNREQAHQFYSRCGYVFRKNQKNFIKLFKEE